MVDIKECNQIKCTFHKSSQFAHMCPVCAECGCKKHMINEDCVECWTCLKDEGFIRSGVPDGGGNKEAEAKPEEQEMVVER